MPYKHPKIKIFYCLSCMLLMLSACALKFGKDFDPSAFEAKVERGVTTQKQVRQWLGAPQSTGRIVENNGIQYRRWLYYFGNGKLTQMDNAIFKTLEVRFDKDNKVASYSWSG